MTLLSDTAYHSFIGEVEALNTTTIRRLTRSRRHQLLAIARSRGARRVGRWARGIQGSVPPQLADASLVKYCLRGRLYKFYTQIRPSIIPSSPQTVERASVASPKCVVRGSGLIVPQRAEAPPFAKGELDDGTIK